MAQSVFRWLSPWLVLSSLTYFTVVSPSTPAALKPMLDSATLFSAQTVVQTLLREAPDLLLDASFEDMTTAWLSAFSEEAQVPLLVLGPVAKMQGGNWTFYMGGTYAEVVSALDEALSCLQLKQVSLVSDVSAYSQTLQATFTATPSTVQYESHLFATEESPQTFVGKVLRPTGNRMTVFITSASTTKELLQGQFHMHVGGRGYANLMPLSSALYPVSANDSESNLVEGGLVVAKEEDMWATSDRDIYERKLAQVRAFLESGNELVDNLQKWFSARMRRPRYVLLNLHNSTRTRVLPLDTGNCSLEAQIYFLGGSLGLPTNYSAPIQVSANFGQWDPPDVYLETDPETSGSILAFEEISSRGDLLPNFVIDLWNFTGGVIRFNATLFESMVMPYQDRFGAAVLPSMTSANTIQLMKHLRKHSIHAPFVGATTTRDTMSSPEDFPGFVRVCVPDSYMNIVIVQTLKKLGWLTCSLVVIDSLYGLTAQQDFRRLFAQSGITILNPPEYQVISASVTTLEEARANYTAVFQYIIDSRCRIVIVIAATDSYFIPLVFYEMGMRRGDLVTFGRDIWVSPRMFDGWNETKTAQGLEVMHGSLQLVPDYFAGPTGSAFLASYANRFSYHPSFSYACAYYDAAYAIGYALQLLLFSGKDFLNATAMSKSLHEVRFTGCSGLIYFNANSNDRQTMRFTLNTLSSNGTNPIERSIGWFDPTGTVLLKMDPTFVWGDGSTRVPSAFRLLTLGCPFEDRFAKEFPTGKDLFLGVALACVGLASAVGVALYWRLKAVLCRLIVRAELEVEDALVMLGLAVEFCQFLALTGDLSFVSERLQRVLDVGIGNIGAFRTLIDGGFTHLWLVAESATAGWLAAVLLLHFLPHWCLGEGLLRVLMELWSFGFAYFAFVPETFILLGSFECTQGTAPVDSSPAYSSSYLAADCYLSCWQGFHICIAVLSAVTLFILILGVGIYRLLWQTRPLLHIHASVLYLQTRLGCQTLQVALFRVFKGTTLHSALILGIRVTSLALSCVLPTYGYSRMRLWHIASEAALVCAAVLVLFNQVYAGWDLLLSALLWTSWVCIVLATLAYQFWRVPSLLFRPKGIDLVPLFKFAFKPVTVEIASNLQSEFQRTNKLCCMSKVYSVQGVQNCSEGMELRVRPESEAS